MTSVLHYRYVREVNLSVPETSSFIHLASTQEPNQIRGKVQIQNTYPIENYYGNDAFKFIMSFTSLLEVR